MLRKLTCKCWSGVQHQNGVVFRATPYFFWKRYFYSILHSYLTSLNNHCIPKRFVINCRITIYWDRTGGCYEGSVHIDCIGACRPTGKCSGYWNRTWPYKCIGAKCGQIGYRQGHRWEGPHSRGAAHHIECSIREVSEEVCFGNCWIEECVAIMPASETSQI